MAALDELQIETRIEQGVAILVLKGWLDVRTYEKLEAALAELFKAGRYRVIMDMGAVAYISSAGAGVLMNAFSKCAGSHGSLVFVNLSRNVLDVLEVLNLNSVFQTLPDIQSALAVLLATPPRAGA